MTIARSRAEFAALTRVGVPLMVLGVGIVVCAQTNAGVAGASARAPPIATPHDGGGDPSGQRSHFGRRARSRACGAVSRRLRAPPARALSLSLSLSLSHTHTHTHTHAHTHTHTQHTHFLSLSYFLWLSRARGERKPGVLVGDHMLASLPYWLMSLSVHVIVPPVAADLSHARRPRRLAKTVRDLVVVVGGGGGVGVGRAGASRLAPAARRSTRRSRRWRAGLFPRGRRAEGGTLVLRRTVAPAPRHSMLLSHRAVHERASSLARKRWRRSSFRGRPAGHRCSGARSRRCRRFDRPSFPRREDRDDRTTAASPPPPSWHGFKTVFMID